MNDERHSRLTASPTGSRTSLGTVTCPLRVTVGAAMNASMYFAYLMILSVTRLEYLSVKKLLAAQRQARRCLGIAAARSMQRRPA